MIKHPFEPIYSKTSKILILGSFPSVKSREQNFYYGHPQNRFWKIIASIYNEKVPSIMEDKIKLIIDNDLAIWDVIKSCEIKGSADNSIKNVVTCNINDIIKKTNISKIVFNGKKAAEEYFKYNQIIEGIEYVTLPSTSPANAVYNFDKLYNIWKNEIQESEE